MTHDQRSPKYQFLKLFVLVPKKYTYVRKIYDEVFRYFKKMGKIFS